jgi:hypothetical protein
MMPEAGVALAPRYTQEGRAMSAVLERLQRGKARLVEEAVGELERAEAPAPDDVEDLLEDVLVLASAAGRMWERERAAERGQVVVSRDDPAGRWRGFAEGVSRLFDRALALARSAARGGAVLRRLAEAEMIGPGLRAWAAKVAAWCDFLDRPLPPLDREQVRRSREAFQRGECEDVAEVIARLETGGPIVKE